MPGGSRLPAGRDRRQPAVLAVALIWVEWHPRGARIPDRQVRLRRHVARRRGQRPAIGRPRVQPQRGVGREEVIGERINAAIICDANATRVAPALGAPGHRELRVGLRAVGISPTSPSFRQGLDARHAHLPLAGDELHGTGDGGGAPQRAERAAGDLDALHVRQQQPVDVAVAAADVDRDPVEHDLRKRLVAAAEVEPRRTAGPGGLVDRHPRQEGERPRRRRRRFGREVPALEDRHGESQLLRRGRPEARRHDEWRELVATQRVAPRGIRQVGDLRAGGNRARDQREHGESGFDPTNDGHCDARKDWGKRGNCLPRRDAVNVSD